MEFLYDFGNSIDDCLFEEDMYNVLNDIWNSGKPSQNDFSQINQQQQNNSINNKVSYENQQQIDLQKEIIPTSKPQQQILQSSLIEKIKENLGIDQKKFEVFSQIVAKKLKEKKSAYNRTVITKHKNGDQNIRYTICSRNFRSLNDEAIIFEVAFYFFTYGKKFEKRFIYYLHNEICASLNIKRMSRNHWRSIRTYFNDFCAYGFEIVKKAHEYCIAHPEFIKKIDNFKANKNN